MVPHLAAMVASSIVVAVLHVVVGTWLSPVVEAIVAIVIGSVVYVLTFQRLRMWHQGY
jgi:hypothetical protein